MKKTVSSAMDKIDGALKEFMDLSGATPETMVSDEGIASVMRLVSDLFKNWQDCPVKRCRRARCCQGPDMICQIAGGPRLDASPDEIASANARMKRIAERHLEEMGIW